MYQLGRHVPVGIIALEDVTEELMQVWLPVLLTCVSWVLVLSLCIHMRIITLEAVIEELMQ